MRIHALGGRLIAQAPAKVNIFLEVLEKRSDGFHEIETLMTRVRIFDTLTFETLPNKEIQFELSRTTGSHCSTSHATTGDDIPIDRSNLVVQAVELLRFHAGIDNGARLHLHKRIPSAAGLGGGSSDAATALVLANRGWKLGISNTELNQLAGQLGSDVPFFLNHSPAICRGRGEEIETLTLAGPLFLVVLKPPVELSTAKVYNKCVLSKAQVQLKRSRRLDYFTDVRVFNRLQRAAGLLTPWIKQIEKTFDQLGVPHHQMTGSGSAYFGICENATVARRVARRLRQARLGEVFCTTACN